MGMNGYNTTSPTKDIPLAYTWYVKSSNKTAFTANATNDLKLPQTQTMKKTCMTTC
jgi:hypothetical protein